MISYIIFAFRAAVIFTLFITSLPAFSQLTNGSASIGGSINQYSKVTAIAGTCPQVFTVSDGSKFGVGNKVLIIQMQGATMNTTTSSSSYGDVLAVNSAGNFEVVTISSISGNDLTFDKDPSLTFDVSGSVQLVTFPEFSGDVTVTSTLTPGSGWAAGTGEGGVICFSADDVVLQANIDASDAGFEGGRRFSDIAGVNPSSACTDQSYATPGLGTNTLGGEKGMGIAIDASNNNFSRNPRANGGGGGNNHNGGGAGGSNYTQGGMGGNSFGNCANCADNPATCGIALTDGQGFPGKALNTFYGPSKLFFGGGGGAGQGNQGAETGGTNGGGIIIIKSNTFDGGGFKVMANSYDVDDYNGQGVANADGAGASGAAGSIFMDVGSYVNNNFTLEAKGGAGGDQNDVTGGSPDASCYAPGGGGAGGVIWFSQPDMTTVNSSVTVTTTLSGGTAGTITDGAAACLGSSNGATSGANGVTLFGANLLIDVGSDGTGPNPDLGEDVNLCVVGSPYTLDPGIIADADHNFTWSTGAADNGKTTIDVTSAGTYIVTFDSAGVCTKTDRINVTDNYAVDLGSDVELCDPVSTTLATGWSHPGVNYQWESPIGTILPPTSSDITVTTPGDYRVMVTDPNCGVRTDDVTITSATLIPTNDTICVATGDDVATLGVGSFTNTPEWYSGSGGGSLVNTGATYTTPALTETTVYYVENTDDFDYTVGPIGSDWGPGKAGVNIYDAGNSASGTSNYVEFDAIRDFTLDNLTLYHRYGQFTAHAVDLRIQEYNGGAAGAVVYTGTHTLSQSTSHISDVKDGDNDERLTIGASLVAGNTYRMFFTSGGDDVAAIASNTPSFDYTDYNTQTAIVEFNGFNNRWAFFDWSLTSGGLCDRVPVTAFDLGCPLPVDWLSFTAEHEGNVVKLEWATSSETNNRHFMVMKSIDGINFYPIGEVSGAGNSSELRLYHFIDDEAVQGTVYYQLQQVDVDGSVDYSDVVSVIYSKALEVLFSYEETRAVLQVFDNESSLLQLRMYDIHGRERLSVHGLGSGESITIPEGLASGIYLIHLSNGREMVSHKVRIY